MTSKLTETSAPTDLELMLYADGELTGERLAAVEAHLAEDEAARRKVLGLDLVSSLLRERAVGSVAAGKLAHPVDDLTDQIMAAISAEPSMAVAPERVPVRPVAVVRRRRRNDNARSLVAIGVVALAAAAGLLFWGRVPSPVGGPVAGSDSAVAPTAHEEAARPDGDVEHGVEVAAVDFGARTGAVFYVPSGLAASSTTTVVWLSDDSSGGDE